MAAAEDESADDLTIRRSTRARKPAAARPETANLRRTARPNAAANVSLAEVDTDQDSSSGDDGDEPATDDEDIIVDLIQEKNASGTESAEGEVDTIADEAAEDDDEQRCR